jgi:Mrp family chromosome partitioning ATPase
MNDKNTKHSAGNDGRDEVLRENMARIRHKIIVLSGKGGVGKSTVAVNLASAIAAKKMKTGLLDIDIHGPSVPTLLGMEGMMIAATGEREIHPVKYSDHLSVMSVGFLLQDKDMAVVWRGPLKYGIIKQFLSDVVWGDMDYLIVDSPPGTGDEPLSVCQLIEKPDGAVIVTTPQDVALADVRKSVTFCRQLNIPVLGVIENMSGFLCPHCGTITEIFKSGGGKAMAEEMGVPFLGKIPIETHIVHGGDSGTPFTDLINDESSTAIDSFNAIVETLIKGANQ